MKLKAEVRKEKVIGFYKGKKYEVCYMGETKWGNKALLRWFNGASKFWVPSEKVTIEPEDKSRRRRKKKRAIVKDETLTDLLTKSVALLKEKKKLSVAPKRVAVVKEKGRNEEMREMMRRLHPEQ